MDKSHAQFVLRSCRPDGVDSADPAFAEALAAAGRDPKLGAWFAGEQKLDREVSACLKEIPVPLDLNASILAGMQARAEQPTALRRNLVPLALAASIALLASIALFWLLSPSSEANFARYREEMVSRLDGRVVLSFQSERAEELQRWLAEDRGLAGTMLPAGLLGRPSIGCRSWTWNGKPAGLICFQVENGQVVHLFIVPRSAAPSSPSGVEAAFEQVGAWETASWSRGELAYVLAGKTDRATLAKLL